MTLDFQKTQYQFTRHLRDPDNHRLEFYVEDRRVDIYRDLLFSNIESLFSGNFPVIKQILPQDHWRSIIRDFFVIHASTTPLFPELPREFLKYLKHERIKNKDDPEFLYELAHYEWTELDVGSQSRIVAHQPYSTDEELLTAPLALSTLCRVLSYNYSVHTVRPDSTANELKENRTDLIVYQDNDQTVRFIELKPASAWLLHSIKNSTQTIGWEHLTQLSSHLGIDAKPEFYQQGLVQLKMYADRGIIGLAINAH